MATYSDDFNRSNQSLITSANWELPAWDSDTPKIIDNAVKMDSGNTGAAIWAGGGTFGREQECEVTMGDELGNSQGGPIVYANASGAYLLNFNPSNGAAQIRHVDDTSSQTTLGAGESFGRALVEGDVVKLKAEDDGGGGTLLTAYLNGTQEFTRTDSTFTSGTVGMIVGSHGFCNYDAWSAEDFSAAAEATVTSIVADQSGGELANQTGITWWWQETAGGSVVDSGTGATTDASGTMEVSVTNTVLTTGQTGYISVELNDGNVGMKKDQVD